MLNKVTVLMPNYNNGPFLEECINSVLAQSFADFCLLIVDDGSSDNSIACIQSFTDSRIRLIQRKQNGGIVAALNDGLAEVKSEYLVRHDGDDIMHPHRISILVDFMDKNPGIDVCSSDIQTFGVAQENLIFERNVQLNKANLVFGHSIGHASSIFRTAVFKDNHVLYSDKYPYLEDYDLFYQLKDKANTTSIPGYLYLYRVLARHDHAYQVSKKAHTFKSFYARVLADLGMPVNELNVLLHFELAKAVKPTRSLNEYLQHINELKRLNLGSGVFPEPELARVLEKRYTGMIYRLIEHNQLGFFKTLACSVKHRTLFIKFWLLTRFKKNHAANDKS